MGPLFGQSGQGGVALDEDGVAALRPHDLLDLAMSLDVVVVVTTAVDARYR